MYVLKRKSDVRVKGIYVYMHVCMCVCMYLKESQTCV
jgi:hypothetical protein